LKPGGFMLEARIKKDYIQAMKDRDTFLSSTLSFLRAQLKNVLINNKLEKLEDKDVILVLKKQVKQRHDSIKQFEAGGRKDLADEESKELAILKHYLPEELSEQQISELINNVIKEENIKSIKEMGKVMKIIGDRTQGNIDNRLVSQLVKKVLL